jgi:hypothetical protein
MGLMGAATVLGVATAAINVRLMRRQRDVMAVRKRVQDALDAARNEITPVVRQQILASQRELERAMRAAVRGRTKDLQNRVAEATQLARADASERERRRDQAQRALSSLGTWRRQVDELSAEVAAVINA